MLRLEMAKASKLKASDFGLDDDDEDDEDEDESDEEDESSDDEAGEETLGAAARKASATTAGASGRGGTDTTTAAAAVSAAKQSSKKKGVVDGGRGAPLQFEAVSKDLASLTEEQRMSALMADAPELLSLIQELTDSLSQVSSTKLHPHQTYHDVSWLQADRLLPRTWAGVASRRVALCCKVYPHQTYIDVSWLQADGLSQPLAADVVMIYTRRRRRP